MEFDWDDRKEASNVIKHGIDFDTAMRIWEGPVVEREDDRIDNDEARFICFGMVDDRVLAVVHTWREDVCRIISARKATRNERKAYGAALAGVAAVREN